MPWRSNVNKKIQERCDTRTALKGMLRILWEDSAGKERISEAEIVNVSRLGAKLRVAKKIPVRSYVTCNDEKLRIRGRASVRYCNFAKGKYEICLEFTSDNGWHES